MLDPTDQCAEQSLLLQVNITSPALGVPASLWKTFVLSELRTHSTTKKLYAGGCTVVLAPHLTSDYHPACAKIRTIFVIGIPLTYVAWEAFPNSKPGILRTWCTNIGHWGLTSCMKVRRNNPALVYSLPDLTVISAKEFPMAAHLTQPLLAEVPSEDFWMMLAISLDRYEV